MSQQMGNWALHHQLFRLSRIKRMYAREFVFAVDYFSKELGKLSNDQQIGGAAIKQLANFEAAVPGVVEVRNSLHHVEDRVRGLGQGGKAIIPQPVNIPGFAVAPRGGLFFIGPSIQGSKVGCTVADGQYVEVDIAETTVGAAVAALQGLIDSFPWNATMPAPQRYPDLGEQ